MGVSKNNGTPKSSILIGFSIIFTIHFGGPPLFLETPIYQLVTTGFLDRTINRINRINRINLPPGEMAGWKLEDFSWFFGEMTSWRVMLFSIKNWMGPNPNGPRSVSCDRAII